MIIFAGDPHGCFDHIESYFEEHCSLNHEDLHLIILGDLALNNEQKLISLAKKCNLWFIHGNHDGITSDSFKTIWGLEWQKYNLHGKITTIDGVKIAGLGGIFRGKIWMPPNRPLFLDPIHFCQYLSQDELYKGGLPLRHRSSIFPSDIEDLSQFQADILVCHEAPLPHPSGFQVINDLAQDLGVRHIFHGHHHENFLYDNTNQAIKITNVGWRSLADLDGNYLVKNIDPRSLN